MGIQFTPDQQKVIDLRDCNILVSAAAGSGKTAVLVERILRMICDDSHPVDVDRLLIVTFTNAAAAEMRESNGLYATRSTKIPSRPQKIIDDNIAAINLYSEINAPTDDAKNVPINKSVIKVIAKKPAKAPIIKISPCAKLINLMIP